MGGVQLQPDVLLQLADAFYIHVQTHVVCLHF